MLLILNQRQWHVSGTVCVTTVVRWQWQQCQQWDNYKTLAQSFCYDTGSAVGIVTRYDLRNWKTSFDSRWQRRGTYLLPKRPERLWGPPSLLFSACWALLLGLSDRGVRLITHPRLLQRLGMSRAMPVLRIAFWLQRDKWTSKFFRLLRYDASSNSGCLPHLTPDVATPWRHSHVTNDVLN